MTDLSCHISVQSLLRAASDSSASLATQPISATHLRTTLRAGAATAPTGGYNAGRKPRSQGAPKLEFFHLEFHGTIPGKLLVVSFPRNKKRNKSGTIHTKNDWLYQTTTSRSLRERPGRPLVDISCQTSMKSVHLVNVSASFF